MMKNKIIFKCEVFGKGVRLIDAGDATLNSESRGGFREVSIPVVMEIVGADRVFHSEKDFSFFKRTVHSRMMSSILIDDRNVVTDSLRALTIKANEHLNEYFLYERGKSNALSHKDVSNMEIAIMEYVERFIGSSGVVKIESPKQPDGVKECDYIAISDLARIRAAYRILSDVMPESSSVVGIVDYQNIMEQLHKWEQMFCESIKIMEEE